MRLTLHVQLTSHLNVFVFYAFTIFMCIFKDFVLFLGFLTFYAFYWILYFLATILCVNQTILCANL